MSWFVKDYVEIGRRYERERIIALLEENLRPIAASGDDPESFGWREGIGYAIALIKGESDVPEIPQFEGTRAALNNLTIKAENK